MKPLSILLISVLIGITILQAQNEWSLVATTTDNLHTVCFVDTLNGWIGGNSLGTGTGLIRMTVDGGVTWTSQQLPVTNDIAKIKFLNLTTGFACGDNGTILKTTNGGQAWIKKITGSTDFLKSIYFINSQRGWVCGNTTVLFTTDGGETWSNRSQSGAIANYDVAFGTVQDGLLVGLYGQCYKTSDGGNNWTQFNSPIDNVSYFGVQFLSPTQAIVVGGSRVARSVDAGLTWSSVYEAGGEQMNAISFGDSLTGWAVGSGRIIKSSDGGAHWKQQSVPLGSGYLTTIQTPDGIHAWALGDKTILKISDWPTGVDYNRSTISAYPASISADGQSTAKVIVQLKDSYGNKITVSKGTIEMKKTAGTLSAITDKKDGSYTALFTSSTSTGEATITASLNGIPLTGSSTVHMLRSYHPVWKHISMSLTYVSAVAVRGSSIFVATNGHGMYRSTNGGLDWKKLETGVVDEASIPAIVATDRRLYAAINQSIYLSDNDGTNWYQPSSGLSGVRALSTDGTTVYAANGGFLYRADSTGTVWTRFAVDTPSSDIWGLATDGSQFFMCYDMSVNRLAMDGKSWISINSDLPAYDQYSAIAMANNVLYLAGWYVGVFCSFDFGQHWSIITGLDQPSISSFSISDGNFYVSTFFEGIWWCPLSTLTSIETDSHHPIKGFALQQNYPNPFNPSTTISFSLPSRSFVTLKIFDVMGRDMATIVNEEMPVGNYSRQWNASGLPSGVYFYRLWAGTNMETKRLIILR